MNVVLYIIIVVTVVLYIDLSDADIIIENPLIKYWQKHMSLHQIFLMQEWFQLTRYWRRLSQATQ